MDTNELQEKKRELLKQYEELVKKSEKTSCVEIYVPYVDSLETLTTVPPITIVKCKSVISGAFMVLTMQTVIDELLERHPEIKKAVKELKKSTKCTTTEYLGKDE